LTFAPAPISRRIVSSWSGLSSPSVALLIAYVSNVQPLGDIGMLIATPDAMNSATTSGTWLTTASPIGVSSASGIA